jgi:hypothetical protein
MKYPFLPLLGITISLTAIAGSVMAIPNFLPEPELKKLNNIDISSLWTSHPVSVDRSKQNFERLPALVVQQQEASKLKPSLDGIETSAIPPTMLPGLPDGVNDNELDASSASQTYQADRGVAAWCSERYKSYRAADNTYQPYSGTRRQCEPPFTSSLHNTVTANASQHVSNTAWNNYTDDNHVQWCFARYRSYNPDDNTYRAFSGETRACASPYI